MPKKSGAGSMDSGENNNSAMPDTEHPDFVDGRIDAQGAGAGPMMPNPDGPLPRPFPFPGPNPGPLPEPLPFPIPFPEPGPGLPRPRPFPFPQPFPWPPFNFCGPVSGRYRYSSRPIVGPLLPLPGPLFPGPLFPVPVPQPILPVNLIFITVRVDVDRFFPQNRISIEVNRLFPRASAHVIAEVNSDTCIGLFHRRVRATITYRDGDAALIPGDTVTFEATRTTGRGYGAYALTLSGPGIPSRTYALSFESQYFDAVEFEVDQVDNADVPTTSMDSVAHPNRPADLPAETLSFTNVYQRAGFDVTTSPNSGVIPVAGAGANGTWSDGEMHNAMITHWSRFANNPNWAMWVLFARQHDQGRSLGGIMFDDIGPNHRQGTAIFTDSFIQDAPAGDANPAAWRRRMVFWTAVHEMGHAFNLAHAWQKALSIATGGPGDPWIPLANEPESRSFMNYPFRVSGGQAAFFADFRFRFTDTELQFMRHAPRRFVQMGNSNWFANHNFEEPKSTTQSGNWSLAIRPNREVNQYAFLEPVKIELKLTNTASVLQAVEADMLQDGRHITLLVARNEGPARQWQPFVTQCHENHWDGLAPGASIYGQHMISATTSGWLIDEPGFYQIQVAIDMGNEIVVSNVLRIHVMPAASVAEVKLAPDYFTEDVGRVLAFAGAPELSAATDTLREVVAKVPANPAATHAEVALTTPLLRNYKQLVGGDTPKVQATAAKIDEARPAQMAALVEKPDAAAATMGHIDYFDALDTLATALSDAGDDKGAVKVLKSSIATMKKRGVLASVIAETEGKLDKKG